MIKTLITIYNHNLESKKHEKYESIQAFDNKSDL